MGKMVKFLSGATAGALIGVATALLLAPEEGESLRRQIQERLETVREESRRAAEERRAALEAELARLRGAPQ